MTVTPQGFPDDPLRVIRTVAYLWRPTGTGSEDRVARCVLSCGHELVISERLPRPGQRERCRHCGAAREAVAS